VDGETATPQDGAFCCVAIARREGSALGWELHSYIGCMQSIVAVLSSFPGRGGAEVSQTRTLKRDSSDELRKLQAYLQNADDVSM